MEKVVGEIQFLEKMEVAEEIFGNVFQLVVVDVENPEQERFARVDFAAVSIGFSSMSPYSWQGIRMTRIVQLYDHTILHDGHCRNGKNHT
jgi:hypothetical protein